MSSFLFTTDIKTLRLLSCEELLELRRKMIQSLSVDPEPGNRFESDRRSGHMDTLRNIILRQSEIDCRLTYVYLLEQGFSPGKAKKETINRHGVWIETPDSK